MQFLPQDLTLDRLHGSYEVNINDLKCTICQNVLWQPIACQNCEVAYRLACINQWLAIRPGECRNGCQKFLERQCPRFIMQQLGRLQFNCAYSSQGCDQVHYTSRKNEKNFIDIIRILLSLIEDYSI